jgi:hypothetical protein
MATPQTFTMASRPRPPRPGREFPARQTADRCAPRSSPYPPGLSWRTLKRRNAAGFSRIPSRFAHRAQPIRQCQADATLSRLLPPSPATPGSGCPQLHPTAATARRRRSSTSIRQQQRLAAHRRCVHITRGNPGACICRHYWWQSSIIPVVCYQSAETKDLAWLAAKPALAA